MSLLWFSKSGKKPKKRPFLPRGLSNPDIIIDQTDIHLPKLVGTVLYERQEFGAESFASKSLSVTIMEKSKYEISRARIQIAFNCTDIGRDLNDNWQESEKWTANENKSDY